MKKRKNVLVMLNAGKFLEPVYRYAALHNWRITLANDGLAPRKWSGDGSLASYSRSSDQMRLVRALVSGGVPVVGMSLTQPGLKIPRVLCDYGEVSRIGARHLRSRGYPNFAFFSTERFRSGEMCYRAFRDELRALGHAGDVPWFVRGELIKPGAEFDWKELSSALKASVLSVQRPVGVLCQSDTAAINTLDCALAAGMRVPDDVGIVGINDSALFCENQEVPITSINPDYRGIAMGACEMLDAMMDGGPRPEAPAFVKPLGLSERESTGLPAVGNETISRAIASMAEHYAEPIGVEQIAAEMGTSPSSLTRIFRRCAGRTPAAELRRIRIRKVKTFLRTTDFTLEHIADLTGFSHASHLLHVFREQEGISPTEWRRNWK